MGSRAWVVIGVMSMVALCSGCSLFQAKPPEQAVPEYANAQGKVMAQDYSGAVTLLTKYLEANPNSPYRTDCELMLGECQMKLKNYLEAQHAFQKAQESPRTKAIDAKAKAGLGDAMMAQLAFLEAATAYEAALGVSKTDVAADRVTLYLGRALIRAGKWEPGRQWLRLVTTKYPDSDSAKTAKEIVDQPANTFTVQVGAYSDSKIADAMIATLKKNKIEGRIINRGYGPAPYAVRVGSFGTFAAARAEMEKLFQLNVSKDMFILP